MDARGIQSLVTGHNPVQVPCSCTGIQMQHQQLVQGQRLDAGVHLSSLENTSKSHSHSNLPFYWMTETPHVQIFLNSKTRRDIFGNINQDIYPMEFLNFATVTCTPPENEYKLTDKT
ncbi:hypothetical protein E5288_WYG003891 [Bos mutus]|uniref:Uncharacterized protein n=1 Tax=Bos mutus TaxID=72004 RepID=A0A6B0S5B2_9CETA|nr:hypothetical protein [Bos mutus]